MLSEALRLSLLVALAMVVAGWLFLHWRYHIRSTALDDIGRLEERLQGGRPVIVQFHAPL